MNRQRITLEVNNLLSPKIAASRLGITTMTLWRWAKSGKIIPLIIDGHSYYPLNEIERLKDENPKKKPAVA